MNNEIIIRMKLSDNLRRIRTSKPLPMSEIKRKSGLSEKTIYRVLDGCSSFSFSSLCAVCDAMGVNLEEVFEGV